MRTATHCETFLASYCCGTANLGQAWMIPQSHCRRLGGSRDTEQSEMITAGLSPPMILEHAEGMFYNNAKLLIITSSSSFQIISKFTSAFSVSELVASHVNAGFPLSFLHSFGPLVRECLCTSRLAVLASPRRRLPVSAF